MSAKTAQDWPKETMGHSVRLVKLQIGHRQPPKQRALSAQVAKDPERDLPANGFRDWLNVLVGATAVIVLFILVAAIVEQFK